MRDPSASGLSVPSEIQANEMYIATLVEVEAREYKGPPHYNKDGTQKQETSIVWKFELKDRDDLHTICKDDGEPYQQWRFTSDATGDGSFGRDIIEALAGREVTDTEVIQMLAADEDHLPTKLYGKSCLVVLGTYTRANGQEGIGINQQLPLGDKDKKRLKGAPKAAARADLPFDAGSRMGSPPPQQWDQKGRPLPSQTAARSQPSVAAPSVAEEADDDDAPF